MTMSGINGRNLRNSNNSSNEFYRGMVQAYIEKQDYETACFWADKLVSMNGGMQQDVYTLAKCLYLCGQYHRAANLLQHYSYERSNPHFRCLTARCLYMAKEYQKALEILDSTTRTTQVHRARSSAWEPADPHKTIAAQIFLLKGKIYEAMMNRILAAQNYKEALSADIYCVEAFDLLTQHQMLSTAEEVALVESLPFEKCLNNDVEFLKFLYSSKLKKYPFCGEEVQRPTQFPFLAKNLDVLTSEAERHFYNCDFQMAYKVSTQVTKDDPYHVGCLPVYVACLVEMKRATELFKVAHKLVEVMSESALAWYSVGAYYFLIGKHEQSRRNLNKALTIDPVFGPAWLLFGHSFATEREHDQAMAAYFKATQLMKGCHLPLLHVGLECGLSNNPQLAMKFLDEARLLAPKDPFIRHEMGVVKFNEKKFDEALVLFKETEEFVDRNKHCGVYLKKWESLYNNLGQVSRKLKKYDEAQRYHQKALLLCPANASTHSAIGLVHAVAGRTEAAIESFHKALSLRRDDAFSTTMLRYCIEKLVEESNNASDDEIVASDVVEDSDEESQNFAQKYSVSKKKGLDTSQSQGTSGKRGHHPKTPDTGDMPGYLSWFKDSISKIESGPGGRGSDGPRHTSTPAAGESSAREKRMLSSGTEESEDRYPITRRKNRGRNSESSSEGERNITGNASSSDAEANE